MSAASSQAAKPLIRMNAFAMQSPVHQSPGLWRHPHDRSLAYNTLDYWIALAKTLERGLVDALFIADSLEFNDIYGGNTDAALRHAAQVPKHDPLMSISAMAAVTEHLGFGVTSNANHEPPYPFARRMSTLDHLTGGRIGWNVVTGYSKSSARALGQSGVIAHDDRYDIADEYMELVYKLWEGSWQDGAAVRDRSSGVFALPEKVRRIVHEGRHFKVDAIHLAEPSPQRTPLLFQAGSSSRGKVFAGKHAECVYVSGPSTAVIAPVVASTRAQAVRAGRRAEDILFFAMATIIVGHTAAEARAKLADYEQYVSTDAALALFSGWTGIDFSRLDPDEPIRHLKIEDGSRSALENFTTSDPGRIWTVGELARHNSIGGRGPVFVGSPAQVADEMEAWVDATGIDGFNLSYAITPQAYEDFADLVVPELQRRGRYKREYAPGTLREKLFPQTGAFLPDRHTGAAFRFAE
ncbi:monooxygenase [Burkholderia sp. SFA1]|uniref:LLM class flavin-dependent oxidoreductase n=1 Tax=Caballeronia sp. CLC5 TaxID=2906764 RepID=UPI001F25C2B2|nr:LLM class flavin-dependent oxidoreductase [Caballeronia sp. CLC5]MCE4574924.1 LLM class flavin-dependent oxidoreductase [Caballeronia sp. CLC5]BBQ00312.1 monooxygenase [Burkholderia sp. SFA1]